MEEGRDNGKNKEGKVFVTENTKPTTQGVGGPMGKRGDSGGGPTEGGIGVTNHDKTGGGRTTRDCPHMLVKQRM